MAVRLMLDGGRIRCLEVMASIIAMIPSTLKVLKLSPLTDYH